MSTSWSGIWRNESRADLAAEKSIRACLNMAEKALPISQGSEAGAIRVAPRVLSISIALCGSLVMTAMITVVSVTIVMLPPNQLISFDRRARVREAVEDHRHA